MDSKRTSRGPKRGSQKINGIDLKEGRPTTSAEKYKWMETRTTGTSGGDNKYSGNQKIA